MSNFAKVKVKVLFIGRRLDCSDVCAGLKLKHFTNESAIQPKTVDQRVKVEVVQLTHVDAFLQIVLTVLQLGSTDLSFPARHGGACLLLENHVWAAPKRIPVYQELVIKSLKSSLDVFEAVWESPKSFAAIVMLTPLCTSFYDSMSEKPLPYPDTPNPE
eukprot:4356513-Amphidinium_carterae.2